MKWLAECMAEPPDEYKSKDDFQKEVVFFVLLKILHIVVGVNWYIVP